MKENAIKDGNNTGLWWKGVAIVVDIAKGLNNLKRHSGRIPEWQRKHLPGKPGRRAIAAGNSFLAPKDDENVGTIGERNQPIIGSSGKHTGVL